MAKEMIDHTSLHSHSARRSLTHRLSPLFFFSCSIFWLVVVLCLPCFHWSDISAEVVRWLAVMGAGGIGATMAGKDESRLGRPSRSPSGVGGRRERQRRVPFFGRGKRVARGKTAFGELGESPDGVASFFPLCFFFSKPCCLLQVLHSSSLTCQWRRAG